MCLPRPLASPPDAGLYALCRAYREGRLSAPSYKAALLDYPVLIAAVTALAGLNDKDHLDAKASVEATLRGTAALQHACSAAPPASTGLAEYCLLLNKP